MNWSSIIVLLLKGVGWVIKNKLDDAQQRQLGREDAVKEALELLNERVKLARAIDEDSAHWSDVDVADRVRFRDEPVGQVDKPVRNGEGDSNK